MLFTLNELFDLTIMIIAIGYIFSGFIKREPKVHDPFAYYQKSSIIEDIKFGAMIAGPAIVLHELAHKFVAMGFGAVAILHAPINWYIMVIIMRLLNFPFMFFVGGYVTHTPLPPLESSLVSIAGPLTNLILYGLCQLIVNKNLVNKKHHKTILISGKINLFLAAFNMIPLPGFDGFNFFYSIIKFIF